jgi:L-rhamnose mutarotase
MHVDGGFDAVWDKIDPDPVNIRWQQAMSAYFVPKQESREGERFPMMQEVFYLE